jgi:hypothetical protein
MEQKKRQPNDKQALLDAHNYEIFNLDLLRKVFPRIIAEHNVGKSQRKHQIRDIITLYFYLLSYVNGEYLRADGSLNERFGASFPSRKKIEEDTGITERRIKTLVGILEANGLINSRQVWNGKLYFVSYCPRVSPDGYIVSDNGEKIVPKLPKHASNDR